MCASSTVKEQQACGVADDTRQNIDALSDHFALEFGSADMHYGAV